jgi:DNA repair photolyase
LSPGLDFETRLFMKPEAAALLETELKKPGYQCRTLAMGTNTDPYQPAEREHRITRQVLKVLSKFNHPVSIVTKSALILRDIDILGPMAERGLASAGISITTLDRQLARRMEPRAASPAKRLATITGLAEAGIPVRVMASPIIPGLNDHELEAILKAAGEAGSVAASYILLRLPLEVKELFSDWLESHYPDRASRVLQLVRDTRQGKLNDARWNSRFVGEGVYAKSINRRFAIALRKLGLDGKHKALDCGKFERPAHLGEQLSLL